MSDIKCSACKTILSEPLPERCPSCQLEGLNRMFLTLEDYEDWKKNVLNKHLMKMNCQIFAGYGGVLLLIGNVLYGFGDNTQGQYGLNHIGKKIDKPEKIADNVISTDAGYNYSLYLDAEGKVHFLGNSGIPFKERFNQGNLIFKKIYTAKRCDIFWGEDLNGDLYVWGANLLERHGFIDDIHPNLYKSEELLKVLRQ